MKKIIFFGLVLLILITPAFAGQNQQGIHKAGTGLENPELKEAGKGTEQGLNNNSESKVETGNKSEVKISAKKKEQIQEQSGEQNRNQIREHVQTLIGMEDRLDGIGPQVSTLAQEFNNSVKSTEVLEEKIQKRSRAAKWFFGGDTETAEQLEAEVLQNKERIQQMKQLKEQCSAECNNETIAQFQEQIQNLEQEQERLQRLADKEKGFKGLFGWLRN